MGWHSSQTMETYTHTMNARKALLEVMLAEEDRPGRSEPQNEGPPGHFGGLQPETRQALSAHASPLDDDEFSWYEEE